MSAARARIRRPTAVSAAIAGTTVCLLAVALGMTVLVPWPHGVNAPTLWFDGVFGALVLTFGGVGAVLAARLPGNKLGWLMAAIALCGAASMACGTYAGYNVDIAHGAAPAGDLIGWIGNWAFQPAIVIAIVFVPLLFPSGQLPSKRWRWFAAFGVWAIGTITLYSAFGPWGPGQYPGTPNPYEVHGPLADALAGADTLANVSGIPALLIVFGSLVVRFRRSRGVERQQFKLFAYAGGLTIAANFASNLTSGPISDSLFLVAILVMDLVPIAIGVAVLRYRLYEIDVVINRTLVYGSLTAVLLLVYALSVLSLEAVLSPLTRQSSLAVAASTLLVAALFMPVRGRIQTVVDRRFYRRRYDASREIAGFGSRVRDEVEPERLVAAIAATLERTVEPTAASIWLREAAEG